MLIRLQEKKKDFYRRVHGGYWAPKRGSSLRYASFRTTSFTRFQQSKYLTKKQNADKNKEEEIV